MFLDSPHFLIPSRKLIENDSPVILRGKMHLESPMAFPPLPSRGKVEYRVQESDVEEEVSSGRSWDGHHPQKVQLVCATMHPRGWLVSVLMAHPTRR